MDLIKVRQQTAVARVTTSTLLVTATSTSTYGMLNAIFVTEGVRGLYSGVAAPLVAVVPAFATMFWSYDLAKTVQLKYSSENSNTLHWQQTDLSLVQIAIAGGFSGIPLALVLGPLERIKCLMQVNKNRYNGFGDCARQVYREGGIRSVFRGTGMTMIRDVPGNAAYFAAYEFFRRKLTELSATSTGSAPNAKTPIVVTLFAGGMAGVSNWIVAIPFDVLKSRWQTAAPGTYISVGQVLQKLLEKEGPAALFRGLSPALLRAFPANAACLLGVETAKSLIPLAFPSASA